MPFSLQKIHWNESTKTVIYRSRKHWRTKRNFEVFQVTDFIAAAVQHIPPKGQQTVRYYGLYSNKSRGMAATDRPILIPAPAPVPLEQQAPDDEIRLVPPPPKQTVRALRPLWRDLIIQVWGGDPLRCPCCKARRRGLLDEHEHPDPTCVPAIRAANERILERMAKQQGR